MSREKLRQTFGEDAELYDRVRPTYPPQLYDDLTKLLGEVARPQVLEIELPASGFDLVISATAFHWLDPATRVQRCADVLRPGGALAVVSTHHVAGGSEQFFGDVQGCYERFMDDATKGGLPAVGDVPEDSSEFDSSGRFGPVGFRRYGWEVDYSTAEYLALLGSYSGHRALTKDRRDGLYECIGARIDAAGGSITKRYMTQLSVGISLNQPLA